MMAEAKLTAAIKGKVSESNAKMFISVWLLLSRRVDVYGG